MHGTACKPHDARSICQSTVHLTITWHCQCHPPTGYEKHFSSGSHFPTPKDRVCAFSRCDILSRESIC